MIMNIVRYDPFRELRGLQDEMTRLFSGVAGAPAGREEMTSGNWFPKVDIFENKDHLVLEAELLRRHAHDRKDGDRIHLHAANSIGDGVGMIATEAIGHREAIIEEGHVKFAGFQNATDLLVIIRRYRVVARSRVTPGTWKIRAILCLQEADHRHLPLHA